MTGNVLSPILIEFVGIPGSGKTTLAKALLKEMAGVAAVRDLNEPLVGRSLIDTAGRRFQLALRFIANRPTSAICAVGHVLTSRQRSAGDFRAVATALLCKMELTRRVMGGAGIHVSDEGIIHALWSTAYSATMQPELSRFMKSGLTPLIPPKWVIVVVDVDSSTAHERLLRRGGRPNRLAKDSALDPSIHLKRAVDAMASIKEMLADLAGYSGGKVEIHTVKNDIFERGRQSVVSLGSAVSQANGWGCEL